MNKLIWHMVFGISLLLAGCSNMPAPTVTLEANATVAAPTQITVTPSMTSTFTPNPSPLLTQTITQTSELFSTKTISECHLPCWWGITPGVTTWETAYKILEQLKSPSSEIEVYDPAMSIKMPEGGYIGMTHDDAGIINAMGISTSHSNGVEYYDLLTEYGEPSNIYLFAYEHYQGDYPPASVILYYEGEGILAEYEFTSRIDETNNIITVCPIPEIQRIKLSPKGTISSFDTIKNFVMGISDFPMPNIEDSSNISKQDFYARYKDKNQTKCFETTASMWP